MDRTQRTRTWCRPFGIISDSLFEAMGGERLENTIVAAFNERSIHADRLEYKFASHLDVELISDSELESILKHRDGWEIFYERFPDARGRGWMGVSRVGFSADSTQALFYFEFRLGGLNASGQMMLMRRYHEGWRIENMAPVWDS